ncbi:MAG: transcription termination factor NusA [Bacilli bacterium]|nr:transcription termination factor NusA [Bacilli bacterium]
MVINAKEFREAIEAIELSKGISRETILSALEEAMKRGYRKELGGDDAVVEVLIDDEKGIIEMYNVKDIVEEVEDDFLQVSPEDAKELEKEGKGQIRGDKFYIDASIETLRKATANSIKSILKQKFAEAEKAVLYEMFKDKINTMITGKVEKADEKGCQVNIGRTSVYLPRKEMIGDEKFTVGSDIRLFVQSVESGSKGNSAHIVVTRAGTGFLEVLFNEEIREIYDGSIIIKGIAREAGERSKVAVYAEDPQIDPAGACIGQNGNRIQKIVSQLGNGQAKEKIDIIAYSDNPGLYVMEALKPARVVGVICNPEEKKATVVVKDDSLSLAIGRRGVNARLAVRLTGYDIDIKTETDALNEGLEYQSLEELQALEEEALERKKAAEEVASQSVSHAGEVLPGLPEGYVAPDKRVYEDEDNNDIDEALLEKAEEEVVEVAPVKEEKVEEPSKEEVKEEVAKEVKEVKTTTTLSDLEKTLESESNKSNKKSNFKKNSRKKKEDEEEEVKLASTQVDPANRMSIYTEEELREMEEEEEYEDDVDEEDVDYDEYDEYYDDDEK